MNPVSDPLAGLKDIHLPEYPGWWPPAPGWWLLTLALIAAVVMLARWLRRRHQAQAPLRSAIKELGRLKAALASRELDRQSYVEQVNVVLKRLAHTGAYAKSARTAWGSDWLQLLDTVTGSSTFSTGVGRVLGRDRYRPSSADADDERFDSARFAVAIDHAARGLARVSVPGARP